MKRTLIVLLALVLALSLGLALAVPVSADSGTIYYVCATTGNDDTGDGSEFNPWKTIQHGIDNVASGDTIMVAAGTYDENLFVDRSLSLIGAGRDVTTVQAVQGRNYNGGGFQSPIVRIEGDAALLNLQPIEINAPAAIAGAKSGGLAAFGPAPGDSGWVVSGEVVYADPPLGDGDIDNVEGKIALIDRGAVAFSIKAYNAQEGGAIGVIIANTDDDLLAVMAAGDYADEITIPVVMIRKSDADAIKAELDEETVIATYRDDYHGPGGVTISGFTFKGNIPATPQSGINGLSTQGIETDSTPWPWPARQNIVITDNAFVFCGKAAILYNVVGFEVRNNIAIRESHGGQIIGGGIFHNSGGGFGVIADNSGFDRDSTISVGGSRIEISGNVIEAPETPVEGDLDIAQHAITVLSARSIDIVGNTISGLKAGPKSGYTHGWQGAGVSLHHVNHARVEGNTFEDNSIGVRVQVGTATQPPILRDNAFLGNFYSVFNHAGNIGSASVEVDARSNYWGTAEGPTVVSVEDFGASTWAEFYALLDDPDHAEHAVSDTVLFDPWWADEDMTVPGSNYTVFNETQGTFHATIQDAIDAAHPGDTIQVLAGKYAEQLTIDKNLTILGIDNPTIEAPDTRETREISGGTSEYDWVVLFEDVKEFTFDGFVVDGREKGTISRFVGILVGNSEGAISGNEVVNVRPGSNAGGIVVIGEESVVNIEGNEVRAFQKGGIVANLGATASIVGNTVAGDGPIDTIAQNGIQIGFGATGTISGNIVSDIYYDAAGWMSCGILVVGADNVLVEGNEVFDCLDGIALSPNWGTIENSNVIGNEVHNCDSAIIVQYSGTFTGERLIADNQLFDSHWGILLWDAEGWVITGNSVDGGSGGIVVFDDSNANTIEGNTVTNNAWGILVSGSAEWGEPADTVVRFNSVVGNTAFGLYADQVANDVDARYNWWGHASGPSDEGPGTGDAITENVAYSPWLGFEVGTEPMTWVVDDTGSIQDAIDEASAGDTIKVKAGTYPESITIDKQLTVQSEDGAEHTIIDRGNINTTLVNITANGVDFSGFTVQNARNGIRVRGSGSTISDNIVADISRWSLDIGGDGHLIEGNTIRDQGSWGTERQPRGFFIYGAESITARNNELINAGLSFQDILDPLEKWLSHDIDDSNTVNGKPLIYWKQRSGEAVPENAGTVWLIDCDNITVENLDIKDTETGIYIAYGGGGNTISNNTIGGGDAVLGRRDGEWNIGWRGVIIRHSEENTVSGNTVLDARGGIEVRAANDNEISGNTVVGSREGIVIANSDRTIVRGNEISECRDGVLLWSGVVDGSLIEGNTIFDNTNGINFAHGHSFPNSIVLSNSVSGNTDYGVLNTGEEEIDARYNWWGDASGPYHETLNPDGEGNHVSGNVDFEPWWRLPKGTTPTVETEPATDVDTDSATLNMSYTVANELEVDVRFAWREVGAAEWEITDWVGQTEDGTYSVGLSDLDSDTTYEFKAQLRYNTSEIEGVVLEFTTLEDPVVTPPPAVEYTLTIGSTEGGLVITPGEGVLTYDADEVVGLDARADDGYRFVNWTGDTGEIDDPVSAVTTITMKDDYSITANFEAVATPPEEVLPPMGCWIATAAYGTPSAEEINVLREFRDSVLLQSAAGSRFVSWYYETSPPVAEFIAGNEPLRAFVREVLVNPVVWLIETTGGMWRS